MGPALAEGLEAQGRTVSWLLAPDGAGQAEVLGLLDKVIARLEKEAA